MISFLIEVISKSITIFSAVALFITLLVFIGRMCFGWFRGISPIRYKVSETSSGLDAHTCTFSHFHQSSFNVFNIHYIIKLDNG